MPKEYEVGGTTYEFPDNYSDDQVQKILTEQGVIKAPVARHPHAQVADAAADLLTGIWSKYNPMTMLQGAAQATVHPLDTANAMLTGQSALAYKAKESFDKGDYLTGVRQSLHYLLPLLGQELESSAEKTSQGKVAEGIGEAIGTGTMWAGPGAVSRLGRVRLTPGIQQLNPTEQAAINFVQNRGVTVPAGTATGNKAIQGVQNLAAHTPGGSLVAGAGEAKLAQGLQRVAGELAQEAYPQPVAPEAAGAGVRNALESKIATTKAQAKTGYALRDAAEADPRNLRTVQQGIDPQGNPILEDVPMPIDTRQLKASVRPIFEQMSRDPYWTVTRRDASSGYKAVETIVNGPDFVSPSTAEGLLSSMKTLGREGAGRSQGIGKYIVPKLQDAIDVTVGQYDPQALAGLQEGRALTAESFTTRGVLKKLREEPVQAFQQMTYRQDANIDQLRAINREAPGELQKVGRAWLEKLTEKATKEGGFRRAQGLLEEWNNLGPGQKALMFPNPLLRENLGKFFLAAKKVAENPNPSGSALVGAGGTAATLFLTHPITAAKINLGGAAAAALFYSPKGVNLLTKGLTLPLGNRAAALAAFNEIMSIAGTQAGKQQLERERRERELQPAQ